MAPSSETPRLRVETSYPSTRRARLKHRVKTLNTGTKRARFVHVVFSFIYGCWWVLMSPGYWRPNRKRPNKLRTSFLPLPIRPTSFANTFAARLVVQKAAETKNRLFDWIFFSYSLIAFQEGKRRMTDHVECDICHETRTWRGFSNHRKWCLYVQAVSATRSPAPEARKRGRPRMEPTQARKRGRPNKTQATERRPENPEVSTQPPPEEENPGSVGSAPPEMVAADIEETIYDSDFQANGDWSSIDAAQVDRQDRIDDDLTTQVDETEDGPPEAAQPTAERQDDEPSDDDSACPNATDQEIWPDPIDLEQDLPSQPQPEEGAELEDSSYFTTVSIANSDDPRDESYCLDDPHSPFDTVQEDAPSTPPEEEDVPSTPVEPEAENPDPVVSAQPEEHEDSAAEPVDVQAHMKALEDRITARVDALRTATNEEVQALKTGQDDLAETIRSVASIVDQLAAVCAANNESIKRASQQIAKLVTKG
eukprot:TRINITY_DN289_c1_g1_i19.p1 TRINITY_DN289_c1_g1~~TRINITY_DN289_c1_g1_i19.p1  ORF type:complete len:480 (+),score=5.18 TRINITY_DN289_c1_g1_i19:241-1680(+)